ncbi:hypothetical protein BGY98DRAFT_943214, partial [Russula aff. rugulosa BPL654]
MMTNTIARGGFTARYNDPPICNLITFGSQHKGISDIPPCKPYNLPCNLVWNMLRAGVYRSGLGHPLHDRG